MQVLLHLHEQKQIYFCVVVTAFHLTFIMLWVYIGVVALRLLRNSLLSLSVYRDSDCHFRLTENGKITRLFHS